MLGEPRKAVFLDKDGTVLENVPYNVDVEKMRFAAGVTEGLPLLAEAGFRLVIVSNQSGVARGYFTEEALLPVEQRLGGMFHEAGVELGGFLYCPHLADGIVPGYSVACACRKPEPGLILRAAREMKLDLAESWLIGDEISDVEAGRRAGCRTALVGGTPGETRATVVGRDFADAARLVAAYR